MLIPYQLLAKFVLAASGQGTFAFPVPQGQTLNVDEMVFTSTGAWQLVGLSNSNGLQYTNATPAAGIPSVNLSNGANNNNNIRDFKPDLVIKGGEQLLVTILDTSVAPNTVNLVFNCSREMQA